MSLAHRAEALALAVLPTAATPVLAQQKTLRIAIQMDGDTPFRDVRARQGLNCCVDRAGLVGLLDETAEPSVGWLKPTDPAFGQPANRCNFDPARGKALLAEAGFTPQRPLSFKVLISTSGSGQMPPLPMNEHMRQNLREACGVNVSIEVTEWNTMLVALRSPPGNPTLGGAVSMNPSSPSSDPSVMVRYFSREGQRAAGGRPALALHRPRFESPSHDAAGARLRQPAILVR